MNAIRAQAGTAVTFIDDRISNASARGTYYCFALFVYGFLAVIALIAVFNVINSIAMSVCARTRQYGVFRALGLTDRQLARMVTSEAATYTVLGGILGTALGLAAIICSTPACSQRSGASAGHCRCRSLQPSSRHARRRRLRCARARAPTESTSHRRDHRC